MKTKVVVMGIGIVFFLALFVVPSPSFAQGEKYVFGSGPMGGPWRIGVGAGVQVLNEQLKGKYSFTAAASGGSVENMRRMMAGEYDTIWVHQNNLYDAWNGVGLFAGQKPFKDVRALEYMTDQAICIATLAKTDIRKVADLAGKKVNIGPAGSGGVPIAKAIFEALGLTDKVKIVNISFQAGAQALKDGQIDVNMNPGGPYVTPAIVEIAQSVGIRLVEPTAQEAEKVLSALSYLHLGVIPPNKGPGENADKERKAFFWSMYWVALPRVPDRVVYDMLAVTQNPKTKAILGKVLNYWLAAGPKFESLVKMGVPLHPGAVKFWKEKGVTIPPQLMPK
jgi:TRAP transporter TAXI family solute receptor